MTLEELNKIKIGLNTSSKQDDEITDDEWEDWKEAKELIDREINLKTMDPRKG